MTARRPRDVNSLAKHIVDEATGEAEPPIEDARDPAAVALGRKGGKKGGDARARSLTPARRQEIAKKAARARWSSKEELAKNPAAVQRPDPR